MKKIVCDFAKCEEPPIWFFRNFGNFCDLHVKRPREDATKFVCKHCHVEVVSREDHHAILGKEHGKSCPRKRILG